LEATWVGVPLSKRRISNFVADVGVTRMVAPVVLGGQQTAIGWRPI